MIRPVLPANEDQRLLTLTKFAVLEKSREEEFDRVTRLVAEICDTPIAIISFIDADREWFKSTVGLTMGDIPRSVSFCAHALDPSQDIFIVPDALIDPRFSRNPFVVGQPFVRFYAGAPLAPKDGCILGHVCVVDTAPRQLSSKQQWALKRAAESVIALLEYKRLCEEIQGALETSPKEASGQRIRLRMEPPTSPSPNPGRAASNQPRSQYLPPDVIDAVPGIFYLFEATGKHLLWNKRLEDVTGYSHEEIATITPLELIGLSDRTYVADRIRTAFVQGSAFADASLATKDGREIPYYFTAQIVDYNGTICLAGVGIDISERKHAEVLLRYAARHDPLTGLSNRTVLTERLTESARQAIARNGLVAILFIDLDRFKLTNDTFGHGAGDELLKAVAQRVRGALRAEDMVVRLGGDEFVVLADVQHRHDVLALVSSIRESFLRPFSVLGNRLHVTASIGISLFPSDSDEPEQVVRNADAALYRAKSDGRNSFAFFTTDLRSTTVDRLSIEADLRSALERGEFELYYQPIVDLRTGEVRAAEGLIRWNHPTRGLLLPADFIGVAEDSELILSIGSWVLHQGARQARRVALAADAAFSISVNVSGRQLREPNFINDVRVALSESNVLPGTLGIEITESVALGDPESASLILQQCKELGIPILLDDFGTHYSSLTYLKVLPIDVIKIDKSFVDGLPDDGNDTGIVRAILALGQGSGAKVIAEGVESALQAEWLQDNGCLFASGYFYGSPMPATEFEALIAHRTGTRRM